MPTTTPFSLLKPVCATILAVLLAVPQATVAQVADPLPARIRRIMPDPGTPPRPKLPASPLRTRALGTTLSGSQTVFVPLQAGFNLVSIPLRTSSQMLSDLFPNLPPGSDVWTWDAQNQQLVEGFDQALPFGQACYMWLPMPALVAIAGETGTSSAIPVDLNPGWNLVGVPFPANLDLSQQTVYVNNVQTQFPDAMTDQAITNVASVAPDGAVTQLGSSDTLEEFKGYWMYSSGHNLLMLSPTLLGPGDGSFAMTFMSWGLEKIGGGALSWGIGTLLSSLVPSATAEALAQIQNQLNQIQQGQTQIENELTALSNQVAISTQKIEETVVDTVNVSSVRSDLMTYYDDVTPGASLAWFQQQAASPALAAAVTQQQKTQFAQNVLNTWNFPNDINKIDIAIMGSAGSQGVIDGFANQILLSSDQYTLINSYKAMQAYFAELIGLQIKCATLIENAYNQLAADPSVQGNYSGAAQNWHDNTFQPKIAQEYQYFNQVVERIAVSRLILASKPGDPDITIPAEVQVMLGYADYAVADALNEPGGMRVHVLINPDLPAPSTLSVTRVPPPGGTRSPATVALSPAGGWRTVTGSQSYDSWGLVNNQRQVQITKDWKIAKVNLTGYSSGDLLDVYSLFNSVFPAPLDIFYDTAAKLGTYDSTYTPASSGRVFGSMIVAARADAQTVLDPCLAIGPVNTTVASNPNGYPTSPASNGATLKPCGQLSIAGPGYLPMGFILYPAPDATVSVSLPFVYSGSIPSTVTWQSAGQVSGNKGEGTYWLQLWDGTTLLNQAGGAAGNFPARQTAQNVQFTPGHSYSFTVYLDATGNYSVQLEGVVITPNQ
jgi:hypothetical protein